MIRAWSQVPAQTRLTVWFSTLLAVMIITLGVIALWLVEHELASNGDELLIDKAGSIAAETNIARNRLTFDSDEVPLIAGLEVVRIWDQEHRLAFSQEGAPDLGTPGDDQINSWLAGKSEFMSVRDANGTPIRLYSQPIWQRNRIIGALQIGRAEADKDAVIGELRLYGLIGLVVALGLAWLGGHWLARRVFQPIATITSEAERIDAEALSRRLALPSANDELRRLATAFNAMIARLDEAFERQKQFTADASHELRTPLAVLQSQIELAQARRRDPDYDARIYAELADDVDRLARIVENLFALAQADSGEAISLDPIDIQELVADVGARFSPVAQSRGVHFEVMLDDTSEIVGNELWLTQLISNLLENALRHTRAGGRIALSLREDDGFVEVRLRDTGTGIAPEHLPHVFERFYRADSVRGRSTGGAGLGLAICDWVARVHGGTLSVVSELGSGSTFSLRIPKSIGKEAPASSPTPIATRSR